MSNTEKDKKSPPAPAPEPQKAEPPKPPKDRHERALGDDIKWKIK